MGESLDGAIIVTNKEKLQEYLKVKVMKVIRNPDNSYKVTLAFRNNNEQKVRLAYLTEMNGGNNVQLLDADTFITSAPPKAEDVTVPEKAAIKVNFYFSNKEEIDTPSEIRIYDLNIAIPSETIEIEVE